jgi:flavin reductase (DIM6/NTAB) family NADH-FMN oxidoreductase RutF
MLFRNRLKCGLGTWIKGGAFKGHRQSGREAKRAYHRCVAPAGGEAAAGETAMAIDQRHFRDVMGTFATGVTIITTVVDGVAHGITANSFTSVSLDPPLMLFCLGKSSTNFDAFMAADGFAVNILAADQDKLSTHFAMFEGDRFEGTSWATWRTGAPILDGVVAAADCVLEGRHDAGDHIIIIGRAVRAESLSDSMPLLYHGGKYAGLA